MHKRILNLILLVIIAATVISCGSQSTPKPSGYFRIALPQRSYQNFDTTFPYSFQYPTYAYITKDPYSPKEKYWINIDYPKFKATIHISYKNIHNNLTKYLEDARKMVVKHIPKANAINDSLIIDPGRNLYGLAYDIEGNGVASPYQFILTDSTQHFLRGSLYFRVVPNNDSLQPVIQFIKGDIRHLLKTFHWKPVYQPQNKDR
ncbi:MAG: gliding motility lipoprotein GldD [Bacteroidales bacterium]|nr:gliding motility lipoprotein GldD [Bacteroidales bacterium]